MSLHGYKPKTKLALWKQLPGGLKPRTLVEVFSEPPGAAMRRAKKEATEEKRRRDRERRRRETDYKVVRRAFLKERPTCEACVNLVSLAAHADLRPHPATEVHHKRGRLGTLLLDTRFWIPCCQNAHDWIHRNITAARAVDLIAQPGQWNKAEPL